MAQEFNTSLIHVTANFLQELKVPFTKKALKQRLEANPHYPSLYSISSVFDWHNIENKGLKIEPEQLSELPLPFMAYLDIKKIGSKDFVSVTKVTDHSVTYYDGREQTISRDEFIKRWSSNIVFLAETTNNSKEKNFEKNKKTETLARNKTFSLILGFGLILLAGIFHSVASSNNLIASVSILFTALTGLSVAIMLLVYEIDKSNTFIKSICTGGTKTNCDSVLTSKAARLFNVSWSEYGFFYFFFLVLFLLIPGISFAEKIPYISFLFILSALYIPFSIYYQYKVVKQWCRLCLAVQAVLLLNLGWSLLYGNFAIYFSKTSILFFAGCAMLPILLWYTLKPIIIKAKDADKFLAAYKRLSTRLDVFNLSLADQPEAPDGWQNLGIVKGNPNAENVILKVCSPACPHCNRAHAIFNELLESNDNIKLITIYDVTNKESDDRKFPVKYFLALAEQDNPKGTAEAMDYWYLTNNRTYDILQKKFLLPEEILERQSGKIDEMADWCRRAEIEGTPTVFINGKQLPMTFNLEDLKDIFM